MMHYNEKHLSVFSDSLYVQTGAVGSDIQKWWHSVTGGEISNLPSEKLSRHKLKNLCADKSFSNKECLGAVMAWGGQSRGHGRTLFKRFEEIDPIISDMRAGRIDHIEAYKKFDQIWKDPKPLGMGAAYFTKLIFFCDPSHSGFIMDQWTSKSTNLLCNQNIVHLSRGGYVTKENDHNTYQRFCAIVCDLASKLNEAPENIEMAMFSSGGRKKEKWRKYLSDIKK